MLLQVDCIHKREHHNPHERILSIGGRLPDGRRWSMTEQQAIAAIRSRTHRFYVSVNGRTVDVVIAVHNGREYLKTTADWYSPDNLLSLRECSW